MKKIASFTIDHNRLEPGIYVSRIDGDITTYDLRHRKPNMGDYIDNATIHSLEHMFATYIRNSALSDSVIYYGPMGCQTGFYLLIRNAEDSAVLKEVKKVLDGIIAHEGEILGKSAIECGHYENLDIALAKAEAKKYLYILNSKNNDFIYP